MKNNFGQYASLIFAIAIFIAALCVPVYLYLEIQAAKAYVAQAQTEIVSAAELERTDSLTKQSLIDTEVERNKLDALAVGKDQAAQFISAVENEGRAVGAKFEVGNVLIIPKEGLFDELSMQVQATGDFATLTRLLKLIETLPYASSMQSVVFDKKDTKGVLWTVTGKVIVPIHK